MAKTFKYIEVPVDSASPIIEHDGDMSGGLQNDALRLHAEREFGGLGPGAVEIVSLLLPTPQNGFIGVSMYCDQAGKTKELPLNQRASSIAAICHYHSPIHGAVFFGRYHDDESMEWERLDFTSADLSSDAEWVLSAQRMNKNKNMASGTSSGMLQNLLKANNTSVVDEYAMDTSPPGSVQDKTEDSFVKWSQTSEEVEVRVFLSHTKTHTPSPTPIKPSDLNIKIKSKSLSIVPKALSLEPWASGQEIHAVLTSGGGVLFGAVDVDSSAWTLERSGSQGDVVVVVTLAKAARGDWASLVV
eukprot:gene37292-45278_t